VEHGLWNEYLMDENVDLVAKKKIAIKSQVVDVFM
jgi:hypothetical protein